MVPEPEQQADVQGCTNAVGEGCAGTARETIDKLLTQASWLVCDASQVNIHAACSIAIREFPLKSGHGFADYLLYIDGKAAGIIEANCENLESDGATP